MNFNELRQKAELLNLLNMQKRKSIEDEKLKTILKIELNNYSKFFEVSNTVFQTYLKEHFQSLGKSVQFLTETEPAKGYKKTENLITKNYIISIYDKKLDSIKPEKRFTYQSKTFSADKPNNLNFNLMIDLFESPIKSSLFCETPGIREVYWKMVEENFRKTFKTKAKRYFNEKTQHYQTEKFNKNKTDISSLATNPQTNNTDVRTL